MAHVLVVGAGLAGARMCALLRQSGFAASLTLVGQEPEAPYDRPPLSKDPDGEVDLRAGMGIDVWAAADEVRLGCAAQALSLRGDGVVVRLRGQERAYDAVVVATGAEPVVPAALPARLVHVLRTRADAARLWSGIAAGRRLVVIGAGWIGCEVAATAAARGARVDVLEAGTQVLPGDLPAPAAAEVASWLVGGGVTVTCSARVDSVRAGREGLEVRAGALVRHADVVLAGVGVRPATGWLAGSGVRCGPTGAVLVDPWGRSSLPGVFAVGDAASRWSARAGRHVPGGHWTEALNAPGTVAPVVVRWLAEGRDEAAWGLPPGGPTPDAVPYVFSDIAGRVVQVLGSATSGPEDRDPGLIIWRESAGGWTAFRVVAGRLVGLASSGRPRDVAAARRVMNRADGPPIADPQALADPGAAPHAMFPLAAGVAEMPTGSAAGQPAGAIRPGAGEGG